MKIILLIDDEKGFRLTVRDRLEDEGFEVITASDGIMGLEKMKDEKYDLALLDFMLPQKSGLDILGEYRKADGKKPIIMLTAKDCVEDKIAGLCTGADDYVTKPFDFKELIARINVLLRRTTELSESKTHEGKSLHLTVNADFCFGPFVLAFRVGALLKNGKRVDLSLQEYKLLCYLAENRLTLVRTEILLDKIWGYEADVGCNTVYTHISWLRKKLKTPDRRDGYIRTVRGMGYVFGE